MGTVTQSSDDNKKILFTLAQSMRTLINKPVTVMKKVRLVQPKETILAYARTKPIIYNEWD